MKYDIGAKSAASSTACGTCRDGVRSLATFAVDRTSSRIVVCEVAPHLENMGRAWAGAEAGADRPIDALAGRRTSWVDQPGLSATRGMGSARFDL